MDWIANNTSLKGETVELLPMQEWHFNELELLAEDKRIWDFIPADMGSTEKCRLAFSNALLQKASGGQFPFVIFHKRDKKIIGSTRLMDIQPAHKKLEIGWTWLHPDYWGTKVNTECKLLLLKYCFESLKALRVQLKTDENNFRSRTAIMRIGGCFEGILRKDWIRDNGTIRNTAYFSIVENEWVSVTKGLTERLKHKGH